MSSRFSRRDFLKVAGGTGIGLKLGGTALAQAPALIGSQGDAHQGKPNVVVIVIDSLRRDHVGIYGNDWIRTPNLDALGRESLRFTRAVPEAMPTVPARRAVHTGIRTFPFRNWDRRKGNWIEIYGWQHIPEDQITLAEQMRSNGYYTMLVTDNPHLASPSMNFGRGFHVMHWIRGQEADNYQPYWLADQAELDKLLYRRPNGELLHSKVEFLTLENELRGYLANTVDRVREEDYFAPQVFRSAARTLAGVPKDKPFFLMIDSFDPHEPWDPPVSYVAMYDDEPYTDPEPVSPSYGRNDYLTERQLKRMRALYAAEISLTDRWLGHFMDRLDDARLLDSTAILLTSDHGIALGEHGATGKPPWALWSEMTDVPYFLRHPGGLRADETSDFYASTHDIAPTVLAMAGLQSAVPLQGADLSGFFDGKGPAPRAHFTTGMHDHVWACDGRYTLMCRNDGADPKVYDLETDPGQTKDLAGAQPELVRRLFGLILQDAGGEPLPQYTR